VKIEILKRDDDFVSLTLTVEEVRYLRYALERATFLDTPPQQQRQIYNFADSLLRKLENLTP
jgi:hypothetical protein